MQLIRELVELEDSSEVMTQNGEHRERQKENMKGVKTWKTLEDGIVLWLQNERRERMEIGNIRKVTTGIFSRIVERHEASYSGNTEYQAGNIKRIPYSTVIKVGR